MYALSMMNNENSHPQGWRLPWTDPKLH
jgi:hypothetical protein